MQKQGLYANEVTYVTENKTDKFLNVHEATERYTIS